MRTWPDKWIIPHKPAVTSNVKQLGLSIPLAGISCHLTLLEDAAMVAEKRKHIRRKIVTRATFAANEHSARVDCLVTDMSQTGARIFAKTKQEMPKNFLLFLATRVMRRCATIWQKDREAGVHFRYPLSVDRAKEG